MKAAQHQGKSLLYLTVEPDDYDATLQYPLFILLHGFGANMQDLASLAPAINGEGYVYACPQAPLTFQIGAGWWGTAGRLAGRKPPLKTSSRQRTPWTLSSWRSWRSTKWLQATWYSAASPKAGA